MRPYFRPPCTHTADPHVITRATYRNAQHRLLIEVNFLERCRQAHLTVVVGKAHEIELVYGQEQVVNLHNDTQQ